MTTDEMRAARERGADQSDFDLIRRNAATVFPPPKTKMYPMPAR
jgi:hypothetical protein